MLERSQETFVLIGAAMEVHRRLGCGLPEKIYQDAFEVELRHRSIPYEREKHFNVSYRDIKLSHDFYSDFLCFGCVVVELKATSVIEDIHKAQVISYLKASKIRVGMLFNFGELSLIYERFYNSEGDI